MRVVCIVPRLPPAIDGVGDFALNLARQWRQDFQIEVRFIVCDPNWDGPPNVEGFSVDQLKAHTTSDLLSRLPDSDQSPAIVNLQFSGYGYAKWACPTWLVNGLEQWKNQTANAQLVTMFHELYNSLGAPWQHNFWTYPFQKKIAIRLACLSDACLTSTEKYSKQLRTLSRGKHPGVVTLPVLSNVGEPDNILPLIEREKNLVIFGQGGTRLRAYRESLPVLAQVCETLAIQRILDVGPLVELPVSCVNSIPIIPMGQRSAPEISAILSSAIAGFINYDLTRLAKSGIFAAYCAHGMLPVTYDWHTSSIDGITAGKQYWTPNLDDFTPNSLDKLQWVANHAYTWYQTHNLKIQAKIFADSFKALGSSIELINIVPD